MTKVWRRFVVDTNVLISRLLLGGSIAARAVDYAIENGVLLVSNETLDELVDVLSRSKFDRYISLADRQEFIRLFVAIAERIEIYQEVRACRDPDDDKFLTVAVNGKADAIVTGDQALLALHPFRNIAIVSPGQFLKQK